MQNVAALALLTRPLAKRQYGNRQDGTQKGEGFFGPLRSTDGSDMTEFSIGVEFDGKEMQIPTFVPTLSKKELDHLLSGGGVTDEIANKAVKHAQQRLQQGKSPYAQGNERYSVPRK